jgi:oligopeptide/dipeptide ABC transporter ATP-binding protein
MKPLLEVVDLTVEYSSESGKALCGLSFDIGEGESVGILGESGSGKSTLALAILRVLPAAAQIRSGMITLLGRNLLELPEHEMQTVRGNDVSLVFQDAGASLHPFLRIGDQIREVLKAHGRGSAAQRRLVTETLLRRVGFDAIERIYRAYPHQLSGGQRQRAAIAQAISCHPRLLIADEPTSSLDNTLQLEVLGLLRGLRAEYGLSVLFISHDPAVLEEVADRILVMYAGRIVEEGRAIDVLSSPQHPFTQALLSTITGVPLKKQDAEHRFAGSGTAILGASDGCRFASRCPDRSAVCETREPSVVTIGEGRKVRCFKYGE